MSQSTVGGRWVRFRVAPTRLPFSRAPRLGPQHASPSKLFLSVNSKISGPGGTQDLLAQRAANIKELQTVATLTVNIGVDPALADHVTGDPAAMLAIKLGGPVLAAAGILWSAVVEQLVTSESPSRPGQPPARESGELLLSIRIEMDDNRLGARVGSNLDYASYLELGTRRMAERPFLLPALERARTDIEHVIGQGARDIVDGRDVLGFDRLERFPIIRSHIRRRRSSFGTQQA